MAEEPSRTFAVTHRSVLRSRFGIVDLGAVGQAGDPAVIGGVSIGALVFDIVFLSFNFLRAGTTGLVAQAVGAGDRREIAATLARAVVLALAIGAILLLLLLQSPVIRIAQYLIGGSAEVQVATAARPRCCSPSRSSPLAAPPPAMLSSLPTNC